MSETLHLILSELRDINCNLKNISDNLDYKREESRNKKIEEKRNFQEYMERMRHRNDIKMALTQGAINFMQNLMRNDMKMPIEGCNDGASSILRIVNAILNSEQFQKIVTPFVEPAFRCDDEPKVSVNETKVEPQKAAPTKPE